MNTKKGFLLLAAAVCALVSQAGSIEWSYAYDQDDFCRTYAPPPEGTMVYSVLLDNDDFQGGIIEALVGGVFTADMIGVLGSMPLQKGYHQTSSPDPDYLPALLDANVDPEADNGWYPIGVVMVGDGYYAYREDYVQGRQYLAGAGFGEGASHAPMEVNIDGHKGDPWVVVSANPDSTGGVNHFGLTKEQLEEAERNIVPEPTTGLLVLTGATALLLRRRRKSGCC